MVYRQIFIDKHYHGISVIGVKYINTFLLLGIFYCFKSCFCQEG